MKVSDIPVAKTLYAQREIDKKDFFVTSAYTNGESGGVIGRASDGEKADLPNGTFSLYRK